MTLSLERINKAREAGYDDDKIVDSIERRDPEFGSRIKKAREAGYDSKTIMESIEKRLNTPVNTQPAPQENLSLNAPIQTTSPEIPDNSNTATQNQPPQAIDSKKSYIDFFKKGLTQSASGELANINQKTQQEMGEDPGFWEALVQEAGTITGDAPYLLAGSTLGASVGAAIGSYGGPYGAGAGGLIGGGFGALAFPEFIKSALQEYKEFTEKGNDITFGEFLERSERVGSRTLNSGLMGSILGMVNKAAPLLKNIPGIGKLFSSKIAQKAAVVTGEAAIASGLPAAVQGRFPEAKDFAHALAIVLGFNVLRLPSALREKLNKEGAASGLTPEEYLQSMPNERIQEIAKSLKENPEPASKDVKEQFPERKELTNEEASAAKEKTYEEIVQLPEGNKKKLAERAFEKEQVRTPDQLTNFLEEYDLLFPGISGKTIKDRNRKFLNKISEKNKPVRKFDIREGGGENVPTPKMSETEKLTRAQIELKEAKRGEDKAAIKEAKKKRDLQKKRVERQKPKEEKQATKDQQEVEKQEVKEFETEVENKQTKSIQKNIDAIQERITKAEAKGKTATVKVLQKNLSIQKKRLAESKAAHKYSVPQNSTEVNTKQPTLVAENPQNINNVNVIDAIAEKPVETLSQGVYMPGFQVVTNTIKGLKSGTRNLTKWVFKKGGQDVLRANPESSIYKRGWRAVEDYMSTKMGLKERFFTRWQDAIGKNKRISRQDREDMIFYRERTGNPFVKNDTFESLSKRMSPEAKEVVDIIVDQHMKESLRLINESPFMSGKGVTPRQAVEDIYIRHFYAGKISPQKVSSIFDSMQKRFGTDNPFKNTRTYLTFDQALREAGLVPKYRDIVQNLAAQDGMLVRVLSNNELISNLHDMEVETGQKWVVRSNNKKAYERAREDGWVPFQDPYMRSYVAGKNKAGKKQWAITEAPALVHPDLAPSLQGVFSKDAYKPDNAVLRLYDRVNSTLNKLHVSASLFHFNALGESFTSGGGFVTSLIMSPKWWKQGSKLLQKSPFVEDAVRHGLKLNRPTDLDLEQANTFYQKLLTKMQASNNLPANFVGKIGEKANILNRIHKFLFAQFQPRMKVITYENYVNRMLRHFEKKGVYPNEDLLRDIKRQSAKATNDQFGGQVWELIPFMNNKQKGMHRVFSFPDWGVSAIREVTGAVADNSPIRRKLGQRYLVEYMIGLFIGGQLLSYASTGMTNKPDGSVTWDIDKAHSTFENDDPKRRNLFDIQMPDFYITVAGDKINVGRDENGRQYYMHGGKKIREIGRYFTNTIANLFSKSSPLIQDATKFALDYTPSEEGLFPVRGAYKEGEFRPWDGTKKHTIDRAISYAKEIAGGTLPYSLQTAVSDLFDSKEQFFQAITRTGFKFIFSGGGGLSVSKGMSLRSSEPYWEEAYNIKNPKEREESLKALRVVLKDYGYKDRQIKTIESKIKRRVEGKAEKR
jgi:hypothetical protein